MHDLVITGGTVVDGTGVPGVRADVAVAGDRIVEIGPSVGRGRRTVDANGLVVAPGFIDSHTHLDAQLFWDPAATPSTLHGVTTVLGGNCGFSVAPLVGAEADYVRRMLARVEGMPLESLEAGLAWDWSGFGEWLARLDGQVAVNAGFFVGHSTIRRLVMGERSQDTELSGTDLQAMSDLLDRSLADGALGLTTSFATSHSDGDSRPVPSRRAGPEELLALAAVVGRRQGTSLGVNPGAGPFEGEDGALLAAMSKTADRVLNWNALLVYAERAETARQLELSDRAAARGGCIVGEVAPDPRRFFVSLLSPFLFDGVPGWADLFTLDTPTRMRRLADPDVRQRLAEGLLSDAYPAMLRNHVFPERMTVVDDGAAGAGASGTPASPSTNGRRIIDLAAERRVTPLDAFLDVAIASRLSAVFTPDPAGDDPDSWAVRAAFLADPRTVIGAADAGAHLDAASSFNYPTSVLGGVVRQRQLLSLEAAVHELTDHPARLFGLAGRGRIAPGWAADLVVFDPTTVGPEDPSIRHDLPAGARRVYAGAVGVHLVIVNGVPVAQDGASTGERPGTVLRSGRDTETVTVADGRALMAAGSIARTRGVAP